MRCLFVGLAATVVATVQSFAPPTYAIEFNRIGNTSEHQPSAGNVAVPTVACPQDGQVGFQPPPRLSKTAFVKVPSGLAKEMALYSSDTGKSAGVLAPKGWHCFGVYGSNGATLYVTQTPIKGPILDRRERIGNAPAVVLHFSNGDTSGRYSVASVAARYFPKARSFVDEILGEGIIASKDISFEPWSADRIHRLSDLALRFETASGKIGLGTAVGLPASPMMTISGIAILDEFESQRFNLELLAVRLPADKGELLEGILADRLARRTNTEIHEVLPSQVDVVTAFYEALGHGDGFGAAEYVVPEKRRKGNLSGEVMTTYFSQLREPLRLISVSQIDSGTVHARYRYRRSSNAVCDGEVIVNLRSVQSRFFIERIRSVGGC